MDMIDLCDVVVSGGKYVVLKEEVDLLEVKKLMELDYSEEECDVKDWNDVNEVDVEKGVLLLGDGYRGEVCYFGYVKFDGSWWYFDIVGEGLLFKMFDDVDEVLKKVVEMKE